MGMEGHPSYCECAICRPDLPRTCDEDQDKIIEELRSVISELHEELEFERTLRIMLAEALGHSVEGLSYARKAYDLKGG